MPCKLAALGLPEREHLSVQAADCGLSLPFPEIFTGRRVEINLELREQQTSNYLGAARSRDGRSVSLQGVGNVLAGSVSSTGSGPDQELEGCCCRTLNSSPLSCGIKRM